MDNHGIPDEYEKPEFEQHAFDTPSRRAAMVLALMICSATLIALTSAVIGG